MKMRNVSKNFVAIDFETADLGRDSACAVGLVKVFNGEIIKRESHLIRPPRRTFIFSDIHGIVWSHVAKKPTFAALWPKLKKSLAGAEYLVAHNASFDSGVLSACCAAAGVKAPAVPFLCTVKLARRAWSIRPTKLPDVCRHLGLKLNHHEALSDAEACANIVLAAARDGIAHVG
jgi:DNA polymerase-3 subunit epsilon